MDPIVTDDPCIECIKKVVTDTLSEKYSDVTVHDFRVVQGATHTNVIFDIVVPFEYKHTDEITDSLKAAVNNYDKNMYAVINVDSKYF
jgi:hypothetical protein